LIISYWNSSNLLLWQSLAFKNSVFFILPITFLSINSSIYKIKSKILNVFLTLAFVTAILNTLNAIYNYDLNSALTIESKTLTPLIGPNFHDLSLIYALAIAVLFYRIYYKKYECYFYNLAFWGLGFCIYILCYRFAIIVFTITALILIINSYKKNNKIKSLIILFLIFLITLYKPLLNRINNTIEDLKSIQSKTNPNFKSLGQRWAALKCATEIIKRNPAFGVGASDLTTEMKKQYEQNSYLLIPENRVFIHNQYVYYTASFGFLGLFYFLCCIGFIINKFILRKQFLALLILIIFLAHMLIENTLENQISSYLFLITMLYFITKPSNLNLPKQDLKLYF
jgi:hypothetical protein